jgi:flagellar biosynthesis protein FliR
MDRGRTPRRAAAARLPGGAGLRAPGRGGMVLPGLGEQEVPASIRLGLGLALVLLLFCRLLAPGLPRRPTMRRGRVRLIALEVVVGLVARRARAARRHGHGGGGAGDRAAARACAGAGAGPALGGRARRRGASLAARRGAAARQRALCHSAAGAGGSPTRCCRRARPSRRALGRRRWRRGGGKPCDLSLRLAAPFVLAAIVINVALGLLARIAPQVQVYFVAIPGRSSPASRCSRCCCRPCSAPSPRRRAAFLALPGLR